LSEALEENEQEFKCSNNITWEVGQYDILNVLRESTKFVEKGCHPSLSRHTRIELNKNFFVLLPPSLAKAKKLRKEEAKAKATVCILYMQAP